MIRISPMRLLGFVPLTIALACFGAAAPSQSGARTFSWSTSSALQRSSFHSRASSWMEPDTKSQNLLYVSDLGNSDVVVFSYPRAKLVGMLTGFSAPHGECVDKAGDVFITNTGQMQILEFAHGGTTPIRKLNDSGYFPEGCAVDPVTGDLAAANNGSIGTSPGGVSIYRHAKGKPTVYVASSPLYYSYFCDFDASGNLFVDGTNNAGSGFEFAELSANRKTFSGVTLNQQFNHPGAVVWDGTNVAVGDQVSISGPSVIYEFSISGSGGSEVGTTPLTNSCDVLQFTIEGSRVIAPNVCSPNVMYFAYPNGGTSTKTIGNVTEPVGTVVSPAR